MNKQWSTIVLLLIIILFAHCQSYEEKKQLTLKKQVDVNSLIHNLTEKLKTLNNAHLSLCGKATGHSTELKSMKFDGATKALLDSKGKRHLLALQRALAYKSIVNDEYTRTYNAYQELLGVSEQLELDLIMFNSFDEANFDKLLEKLEDVLVNVQPMAQGLVIGEENVKLPDLNLVWKNNVAK